MMQITYRYPLNEKIFKNKLLRAQVITLRYIGYIVKENDKYQLFHYYRSAFFTFSYAVCFALGFSKLVLHPQFTGGSAMSAATTFLYLSTGIAYNVAFFQKERIARMLIFLQKDVDKFLIKSDEQEEKLFAEMHKYIKAITVSVWIPTAVAAFIAYVEAFYRIAFGSFWYPTGEDDTETPTLLNRLFPFGYVFDNTFFGFFLPLYALFIGIAIPLWHTFITSLMSYLILKWKLLHKRLSEMDALRLSGYLIDETQKYPFWHFCVGVFFTLSLALSCALEFGKLILSYGQREGSSMSPATAVLYLTTSIAIHTAFFRRKRIARMLTFLQRDLDTLQSKPDYVEEQLFKESYRYMKLITICVWIPSLVAGFMAYIEAFYMMVFVPDVIFNLDIIELAPDAQPLLIRLFPFREVHDDWFVGYIMPLYALFLGIMAIPLWHTFITGMMTYVVLKWKIMHKRLSTMDVSKVILEPNEILYHSSLVGDENKINFLRERMCKFCVVEQIRIRWFARELQELIGIPVFADFIIFSILICFLFYELVTGNPTNMDFVFMCLYLFVMSSILWLYHWHATLIKENSVEMGFAIYSCDWYNYPIKVQKLIQMAMIITARPLEIKAVLVPLSLTTFIDIIRAAYSYFSLLRKTSR